jgi:hypothetical protein
MEATNRHHPNIEKGIAMTSTQLTNTHTGTAIATIEQVDPFAALAASLVQPGMDGTPIKFSKGKWLAGRGNDEYSADGKMLVADLENLMIGWRQWRDKRIVDQVVGMVADHFKPPQRNDLGDLDESQWERDTSGNPVDPWQLGFFMRLVDEEGDEAFAWSATSNGARRAVGKLVDAFAKRRRKHPNACKPLVKLSTDFYRHQSYGRVDVPLLEIIEWRSSDSAPNLPAPDGSGDAAMNDDIPF